LLYARPLVSLCTAMLMIVGMAAWMYPLRLAHAQPDVPREARIQAVLMLRMVKFVDWPADSLAAGEALTFCTWGDSDTEVALQALQGQQVRDHSIVVRKLRPTLDTQGCHVIYVSDEVKDVNPTVLYGSGSRAVLTISDMLDFNQRGGIIKLVRQSNRIGFDIQLRYAREHNLQIGAPLLELARVVN
jgi:hypothetical protein